MTMQISDGSVLVVPTEGAYQKPRIGRIVRETKTTVYVDVGDYQPWKFSKSDMLRTGSKKSEFPRFKIKLN